MTINTLLRALTTYCLQQQVVIERYKPDIQLFEYLWAILPVGKISVSSTREGLCMFKELDIFYIAFDLSCRLCYINRPSKCSLII